MTADTTDRTPLDDPLLAGLRDTLDQVDAAQAAHFSVTPPWERIQQGMVRAKRNRRRTRALRVSAGVLALTAAGAGTLTGVVPYPSFAPVMVLPGNGKSALDDGRTRGSLGSDRAWLKALREYVAAGEANHESGGEVWGPPAARNISVLYAGDVGEYRLALIEGDWHWGPIGSRSQVWYLGPAGAPAERMVQGASHGPDDVVSAIYSPGTGEPGHTTTAIVVLSARPAKVELEQSPVIHADGKVIHWRWTLSQTDDGVYETAITVPGRDTLRVNGSVVDGTFDAVQQPALVLPQLTPARGGAVQATEPLPEFVQETWWIAGQQVGHGKDFQLLAVESPERPNINGPVRAVVGLVTLPSGARVLAGGEIREGQSLVNAGRVLPAGADTSDLSIAWRRPTAPGSSDLGWTAAMGPVGTERVQWVHRDGHISNQEAPHTIAATDQDDVTLVRFLNADGGIIATTRVLDRIPPGAVLPEVGTPPLVDRR